MLESEETAFIVDQIEPMLLQVMREVLEDVEFDEAMVPEWTDLICDGSMKTLTDMNKPFKFAVSCLIMQCNGAGVHSACSCHWDGANDNVARVIWTPESSKGQTNCRMYCVLTAFGAAF